MDPDLPVNKHIYNAKLIEDIKKNSRIVKCTKSYKKRVSASKSRTTMVTAELEIKNDCFLITNLTDVKIYSDDTLLNYYNSRC